MDDLLFLSGEGRMGRITNGKVREQELIDHQEWAWEDKTSPSIPCWRVCELHAGPGIPKEP